MLINQGDALLHYFCWRGSYYSGECTNQGGRSNQGITVAAFIWLYLLKHNYIQSMKCHLPTSDTPSHLIWFHNVFCYMEVSMNPSLDKGIDMSLQSHHGHKLLHNSHHWNKSNQLDHSIHFSIFWEMRPFPHQKFLPILFYTSPLLLHIFFL